MANAATAFVDSLFSMKPKAKAAADTAAPKAAAAQAPASGKQRVLTGLERASRGALAPVVLTGLEPVGLAPATRRFRVSDRLLQFSHVDLDRVVHDRGPPLGRCHPANGTASAAE